MALSQGGVRAGRSGTYPQGVGRVAYMNFSWILEGSLAGAQGPTNTRDITFLKLQDIQAVVRMEENTISTEPWGLKGTVRAGAGFHRSVHGADTSDSDLRGRGDGDVGAAGGGDLRRRDRQDWHDPGVLLREGGLPTAGGDRLGAAA